MIYQENGKPAGAAKVLAHKQISRDLQESVHAAKERDTNAKINSGMVSSNTKKP
jgi:hypothetical protein